MSTEFKLYNVEEKDLYCNKTKEEKTEILYEMVQSALKRGIKPTARKFNTYPGTVRRWLNKFKTGGKEALTFENKNKRV